MITLDRDSSDDLVYLDHVERIANGICSTSKPSALYLVKVAAWFDVDWLRYSGKGLEFSDDAIDRHGGAVFGSGPMWQSRLTIPPFHPHKIRSQHLYRRLTIDSFASYVLMPSAKPLHPVQHTEENLGRRLEAVAPGAACLWYSGDSARVGRGVLMGYVPGADDCWTWYVEYQRRGTEWRPGRSRNISPAELSHIEAASDR